MQSDSIHQHDMDEPLRLVLLGKNIGHSRSPDFLNPLFELEGFNWKYGLMELEPDELGDAIAMMKEEGFRGANVTSPYKELVIPLLDDLTEEAARIGAVNTILFREGRAYGHNTDTNGLSAALGDVPLLRSSFSAAIIGTGGAARAAVEVLLRYSSLESLALLSRREGRGNAVLERWGDPRAVGGVVSDLETAVQTPSLILNATPIGLPGQPGTLLSRSVIRRCKLIYDMVYAGETELMRVAREERVEAIGGGGMFEAQALAAFEVWRD